MSERNHFSGGSSHSRGTAYTYGVSCATSESIGMGHHSAGLHGRARAAVEAEAIQATLKRLAGEIAVTDFIWLRRAVDAAFDNLLTGNDPR